MSQRQEGSRGLTNHLPHQENRFVTMSYTCPMPVSSHFQVLTAATGRPATQKTCWHRRLAKRRCSATTKMCLEGRCWQRNAMRCRYGKVSKGQKVATLEVVEETCLQLRKEPGRVDFHFAGVASVVVGPSVQNQQGLPRMQISKSTRVLS